MRRKSVTPKDSPNYKHHCPYSACRFLGSWAWRGVLWDLYFCRQGTLNLPTVLARYSSLSDDYRSGLDRAVEVKRNPAILDQINDPLVIAMDKALVSGLLLKKEIPE